ncbi:hypothetical protein [Alicyclobacillus fodiniaquatilis]|uniref:Zinc ribbon domain-containing protein n=1 Tax=Alicyclobacillus fodiniaquatilis TaxID=1661150 RepID=A0ABW4JIA1_9BACL
MNMAYLQERGLYPFVIAEGEIGLCPKCPNTESGPANFCGQCGTKLVKHSPLSTYEALLGMIVDGDFATRITSDPRLFTVDEVLQISSEIERGAIA